MILFVHRKGSNDRSSLGTVVCVWSVVVLFVVGCGGVESDVVPTIQFDPDLKADTQEIFVSGLSSGGRVAMVGLPGALPPSVRYQIYQEGTPHLLAEGSASVRGAFALWLNIQAPRVVIRALSSDQKVWGPDIPVALDANVPEVRPVSDVLVSASTQTLNGNPFGVVTGIGAAAPVGQDLIVGGIDTADAIRVKPDSTGAFVAMVEGRHHDRVVVFVVGSRDTPVQSTPLEAELVFGDFPVVLTPRPAESPAPLAFFAPAGALQAQSSIQVHSDSDIVSSLAITTGQDGTVGGCLFELPAQDVMEVAGVGPLGETRVGRRTVQDQTHDVSVSSPNLQWHFDPDVGVWFDGTVASSLAYLIAVECKTGRARMERVADDDTVGLPLKAALGDIIALFAIDEDGHISVPQFLHAETGQPVISPIPALVDEHIVSSAVESGSVLIAGLASEESGSPLLPHARVEVSVAGTSPVFFEGGPSGGMAFVLDGVAAQASLSMTQIVGPYRSDPVIVNLQEADAFGAPPDPAPGLIAVRADGMGRLHAQGYSGSVAGDTVVLANLRTGLTISSVLQPKASEFQREFPGESDDPIAVMTQFDGKSSMYTLRTSALYDVPFVVSAADGRVCVAGPPGTADQVDSVHLHWQDDLAPQGVPVFRGQDDSWISMSDETHFPNAVGQVTAWGLSTDAVEQIVPTMHSVNMSGLVIEGGVEGLRLSNGAMELDSNWLIVVATPGGSVRFVRPPTDPSWTLPLALPTYDHVLVFALHLPSGTATGCHTHNVTVDPLPDSPSIESISPTPLIITQPFTLGGHALTGSSLTIGGIPQAIVVVDDGTITGEVAPETPVGLQLLRVETLAGHKDHLVEVAPIPVIKQVQPSPLIIGKPASIVGAGFGDNPQVWLGGVLVSILAFSDTLIDFVVPSGLAEGAWNMTIYNGVTSSQMAVVVECMGPEFVLVSPTPVMLGGLLTITGDYLLDAKVWINGYPQPDVSGTALDLSVSVDPNTPLGAGDVVAETGCGKVQAPLIVATAPPVIEQMTPAVAVRGKPLNIYGDHLAGASVQIGGVLQSLTIDSKKGLAFVVAPDTPLGEQLLVVNALGGKDTSAILVAALPTIESVAPKVIEVGGTLTILGTHLGGGLVTVGGSDATVLSNPSQKIVVKVGATTPGGVQTVAVTTIGGLATATVEVLAVPFMTTVDPDPLVRGKTASIFGSNLMGAAVLLDGVNQVVESTMAGLIVWTVDLDTPLGERTLKVTTVGGQVSMQVEVVEPPLIDVVEPSPLVSGQPFHIKGTGFGADGLIVSIAGVVQDVSQVTPTSIDTTVTPGTPLGDQSLVVETVFGTDDLTVHIAGPPKLVGANPNPVLAGQPLTVVGVGLMGATVGIGGVVAEIVTMTPTSVVLIVPTATPPGAQTVMLTTLYGEDSIGINVVPLGPVLDSVQPLPLMTGEQVVVSGNYLWDASMTLAGMPVPIQSNTATQIVGIVPMGVASGGGKPFVVSTQGGTTVVMVTVNDGTVMGPPHVTSVNPEAVPLGDALTIKGQYLSGATVLIGGVIQPISVNIQTTVTVFVSAETPVGLQTLQLTTVEGTALAKVEVLPPAPVIIKVSPNPVVAGSDLTVTGDHFSNLQSILLGGVEQKIVNALTNENLVFEVMGSTPIGESISLVIQTLSGSSSVALGVLPAPVEPIEVVDVSPLVADVGETVTVSGVGLSGVTLTVGGVPQPLNPSSGDLIVTFELAEGTPPGKQPLVLQKLGTSSVGLFLSIRPEVPVSSLVRVSSLSEAGDVVFAALPGTFYPGATAFVTTEADLVIQPSQPDGSLGVVFENVSTGDVLSIKQAVDGVVSQAIERSITIANAQSPPSPHAYLTRVEQVGSTVQVYGPAPAFGADDTLVVVVKDGQIGHALAQALHADPSQGVVLQDVSSASTPVWVLAFHPDVTIPGSEPMATFGLSYDPPMLSSGLADGSFCLTGLAGTVPLDVASVTISAGGWEVGPINVGSEGGLFAQVNAKPGVTIPNSWSATVGSYTTDGAIQTDSVGALSPMQVTIDAIASGGFSVSVAANDVGLDYLLVVSTNLGESVVAVVDDLNGTASVTLSGGGESLAVWSVPLYEGSPSACLLMPLN